MDAFIPDSRAKVKAVCADARGVALRAKLAEWRLCGRERHGSIEARRKGRVER